MRVRKLCILTTVDSNFNGYGIGFLEGVLHSNGISRIAESNAGGHKIFEFICTDDEFEKICKDLEAINHWKIMEK